MRKLRNNYAHSQLQCEQPRYDSTTMANQSIGDRHCNTLGSWINPITKRDNQKGLSPCPMVVDTFHFVNV